MKVGHALEQIVIHLEWTIYYVKNLSVVSDERRQSVMEARQIKTNVNDDNFWASCNSHTYDKFAYD